MNETNGERGTAELLHANCEHCEGLIRQAVTMATTTGHRAGKVVNYAYGRQHWARWTRDLVQR